LFEPPRELSGSGGLAAYQISQRAPSTGIFKTTSRKKIGRNPSIGSV